MNASIRSWRARIWNARAARLAGYVGLFALSVLVFVAAGLYTTLRRSLPHLEGTQRVASLTARAAIERDVFGVPSIRASTRNDLAFATGFAHAQDRFFQMDLMRRSAAGELAALLGPALVDADRTLRSHRFRTVAREVIDRASPSQRELLESYVAGVNAGVGALGMRPWEYLALRQRPQPWQLEDSVLAAFSMYLSLHESTGASERAREAMRLQLPPALFAFIHPVGSEWDAPIEGGPWRTPAIPSPELIDLRNDDRFTAHSRVFGANHRRTVIAAPPWAASFFDEEMPGSNAWALDSAHTADGAALLANDMHLGLRLPNVWYHARLVVEGSGSEARDMVGVTLPGLPVLLAGSNGQVAWGFTNSYGDWTDLVIVDIEPGNPSRYLTHDGAEDFAIHREQIKVNGGPAETVELRSTRWGPVVHEESSDRVLALAWTAHRPHATNFEMFAFESARSVEELFEHANRAGGPVQNILAVDVASTIGWSFMGQVPVRGAHDATVPSSWRVPGAGWLGWRAPSEYPRIVNPQDGRLWSANQRMINAQRWFDFVGEGGYDLGARAGQIRDALRSATPMTAVDCATLQTDDRALFLARWRDLLLELMVERGAKPKVRYREAHEHVQGWSGRAAADDVGYRIVRAFREEVRTRVFDMLTAPVRANAPGLKMTPSRQFEGPLWALVTQRPTHLLAAGYDSWMDLLFASLDTVLAELAAECGELRACTWGRANTLAMRHPLSSAIPWLSKWIDMPAEQMNGDTAMPRVQSPSFGASQRLVVSPGREAAGLIQLPGGPVDHPLSPFYGAGHEQWVRGEGRPLLPGEPRYVLELEPSTR